MIVTFELKFEIGSEKKKKKIRHLFNSAFNNSLRLRHEFIFFISCTWLKIARVVTALSVEQWCDNMVIMTEQCCSTKNVVHYYFNNGVQRTMLFTIISIMLFNEQCCSLLFQQCCSLLFQQCCSTNIVVHYYFNNVVHYCFNNVAQELMKQIFHFINTLINSSHFSASSRRPEDVKCSQ